MGLSPTLSVLVAAGLWVGSLDAATAGLGNNRNNFGPGDEVVSTLSVAHSGGPVRVDAYLALVLPNQAATYFFDGNLVPHLAGGDPSTWAKFASNVLLNGTLDTGPIPFFDYTLSGIEPPGIYQWVFGLVSAGTFNLLDLKSVPFFMGPTPVGQVLGHYLITSMIPGGSGTGTGDITDGPPGLLNVTAMGYSVGLTSSYSGSGVLGTEPGTVWTFDANIFGTLAEGTIVVDGDGNFTGNLNVTHVGPFIKSITNIQGTVAGGELHATDRITYTDNSHANETITAVRQ